MSAVDVMSKGWVCPKCGTANAPWKETCDCAHLVQQPFKIVPQPSPVRPIVGDPPPNEMPIVTC